MRLAGIALAALLLTTAPAALGDRSATLAVTGPETVVRGAATDPFTLQGSVGGADQYGNNAYYLSAGLRPASLGPCGPRPDNWGDNPTQSPDYLSSPEKDLVGPADFSFAWKPFIDGSLPVGPYLLCAWVEGQSTDASAQLALTVTRPTYRLTIAGPTHTRVGRRERFGVSGFAESRGTVVTQILPPSVQICDDATGLCHQRSIHRCETSAAAEDRYTDSSAEVGFVTPSAVGAHVKGSFSFRRMLHATRPGTYRYCAWISEDDSSGADVPGPATASVHKTFRVD